MATNFTGERIRSWLLGIDPLQSPWQKDTQPYHDSPQNKENDTELMKTAESIGIRIPRTESGRDVVSKVEGETERGDERGEERENKLEGGKGGGDEKRTKRFQYSPLEDENSIRLLTIQPARHCYDPLVCTISHVQFREKPSYEALSYTWGGNIRSERIILNGHNFYIGQNLLNALQYLRPRRLKAIWADAICINQENIPEKNIQLRIMPYIYMRAHTVNVWLGVEVAKRRLEVDAYQMPRPGSRDGNKEKRADSGREEIRQAPKNVNRLPDLVYENDYWRRLWIIQEVAKANRIIVCCRHRVLWDKFIQFVRTQAMSPETRLLRLNKVREKLRSGSCTLISLLVDHCDAICRDPRDKVYGLKGLACDATNFPVDYGKPLLEVWKDVMEFVARNRTLVQSEIFPFAVRMKQMLMVGQSAFHQPPMNMPVSESLDLKSFHVDGVSIGRVHVVGPSIYDLGTSPESVDAWNAKVRESFPNELVEAYSESDKLLYALLHSRISRTHLSQICVTGWIVSGTPHSAELFDSSSGDVIHSEPPGGFISTKQYGFPHNPKPGKGASRLIQLRSTIEGCPWKMGIASSLVREGDLLVWVPNVRAAILVRPFKIPIKGTIAFWEPEQRGCSIYGCAWVTEDVVRENTDHNQRLEQLGKQDHLCLRMNAYTIYSICRGAGFLS